MNECPFRPDGRTVRWRRSLVSRQPATKLPNKAAHARFFSHSPKSSTLVSELQPSRRLLCSSCVLRGREGDDLQFNILPLLWVYSISTLVPRQSRLPQDVCSAWEAKNVFSPSLQGSAKRLRPGLVNIRRKNCVLLPAAGRKRNFSSSYSPNLAGAF